MIYTVTFNPAIDYVISLPEFVEGKINRSSEEEIFVGGKGINVSIMLHRLGITSKALGFTAGFTGKAIENDLIEQGIETDFIHLKNGSSRINVKIKAELESEINGIGPVVGKEAVDMLFTKLDDLIEGDTLVLAGSIPTSLPNDIYEQIACRLSSKKIMLVIDASGELLLNVLKYRPFLIKPNHHELGEMFGTEITDSEKARFYAEKLKNKGAENVLVSMAENGAVLLDSNGNFHQINAPLGKVVNSVGAGDSMVAGFLAGYTERKNYEYALSLGIAAGSATAFSKGLSEKEKVYEILSSLIKN